MNGRVLLQQCSVFLAIGFAIRVGMQSKMAALFFTVTIWIVSSDHMLNVRNRNHRLKIAEYFHTHHKHLHESGAVFFLYLWVIAAPYMLHGIDKNQLESLQQSLAHVFNVYMTAELLTLNCNDNSIVRNTEQTIKICSLAITAFILILIASGITAHIHRKYITFPIPRTWSMLMSCCGTNQHRII